MKRLAPLAAGVALLLVLAWGRTGQRPPAAPRSAQSEAPSSFPPARLEPAGPEPAPRAVDLPAPPSGPVPPREPAEILLEERRAERALWGEAEDLLIRGEPTQERQRRRWLAATLRYLESSAAEAERLRQAAAVAAAAIEAAWHEREIAVLSAPPEDVDLRYQRLKTAALEPLAEALGPGRRAAELRRRLDEWIDAYRAPGLADD